MHPPRLNGDLALKIFTDKASYALKEPILVHIDLTNISSEPFRFDDVLETNEAQLNGFMLSVKDATGAELTMLPQPRRGMRSRGRYALQPGQVLHDALIANRLFELNEPGHYTFAVRWKYRGVDRVVVSNSISFDLQSGK